MMNWKEHGREQPWPISRHSPERTEISVRIVSVQADLPKRLVSQKRSPRLVTLFVYVVFIIRNLVRIKM
jgi:hypothetical protein